MTVPGMPAGLIHEHDALKAAPLWRREPYTLFFPLGILLSWAGVGRWLAFALSGRHEDLLLVWIFHGMAQIQGFLMCFAIGFLFTMIPRRSGTHPPSVLEMTVGILAPVLTVAAAWGGHWALSQVGWMVSCGLVVAFAARRFLSATARRRPPTSFVWIPVAMLMGLVGSALTGAGGALGPDWMWLHDFGRALVFQGVFLALVLGVGGLALPLMTRDVAPSDAAFTGRDVAAVAGHVVAAVALVASFVLQSTSLAAGCALRAVVVAAVLLLGAELWRPPTVPGWNRRLVWLSAWMLPAGFAIGAVAPAWYQGALHVSFVAGFAMLTLAVSTHVVLVHGGHSGLADGKPWQVGAIAVLMLAATTARVMMVAQGDRRTQWMAVAATFFLAATAVWTAFLVPRILNRRD